MVERETEAPSREVAGIEPSSPMGPSPASDAASLIASPSHTLVWISCWGEAKAREFPAQSGQLWKGPSLQMGRGGAGRGTMAAKRLQEAAPGASQRLLGPHTDTGQARPGAPGAWRSHHEQQAKRDPEKPKGSKPPTAAEGPEPRATGAGPHQGCRGESRSHSSRTGGAPSPRSPVPCRGCTAPHGGILQRWRPLLSVLQQPGQRASHPAWQSWGWQQPGPALRA